MDVAIHKNSRHGPDKNWFNWKEVIDHLERRGQKCYEEPQDVDVSIVLSGVFENPAILKGRKVLAFKPQDWVSHIPPPKGWMLYKNVLQLYYHDFIDLSGLSPKKSAKRIIEYIDEIKEPGSQD
jgi:hypothetical protein